ncbi:hypothetical protein AB1I63_04575 [Streptococcus pneumoniae]
MLALADSESDLRAESLFLVDSLKRASSDVEADFEARLKFESDSDRDVELDSSSCESFTSSDRLVEKLSDVEFEAFVLFSTASETDSEFITLMKSDAVEFDSDWTTEVDAEIDSDRSVDLRFTTDSLAEVDSDADAAVDLAVDSEADTESDLAAEFDWLSLKLLEAESDTLFKSEIEVEVDSLKRVESEFTFARDSLKLLEADPETDAFPATEIESD